MLINFTAQNTLQMMI